jgi:hypothetical protein
MRAERREIWNVPGIGFSLLDFMDTLFFEDGGCV